jgi:hypothetical protein
MVALGDIPSRSSWSYQPPARDGSISKDWGIALFHVVDVARTFQYSGRSRGIDDRFRELLAL